MAIRSKNSAVCLFSTSERDGGAAASAGQIQGWRGSTVTDSCPSAKSTLESDQGQATPGAIVVVPVRRALSVAHKIEFRGGQLCRGGVHTGTDVHRIQDATYLPLRGTACSRDNLTRVYLHFPVTDGSNIPVRLARRSLTTCRAHGTLFHGSDISKQAAKCDGQSPVLRERLCIRPFLIAIGRM